ncbi:MAG: vitamin K epoxide reductase family protein [Acidobacteriota bacterium]|nr:vitamin K epoxide reductase family protein [Blastocatellia bacterium]MDQ3490570.1 vitamin K epoxide reductase family protein [Acidobacteriota bacterium]
MIREALGQQSVAKLPAAAVVVALAGLVDAMYLTVKHYTEEPVPCSIIEGCEMVLTSSYAEIAGVPLAALGAAAYFTAFSLALLAAFGNRFAWTFFGIQSIIMALVTAWLIYLQAAVIGAFCQFCLISAATSFALVILYLVSRFTRLK